MEKKLRDIGLSEYEVKVYLALLKQGMLTAINTSKLSKVPQGKIYNTLYRLVDKGFVYSMNKKPKLFKVIDPKIAIKQYIKRKKEKLENYEKELPPFLKNLRVPIKKELTDEKVSVIWGKKNAFIATKHIFETAKKSIDFIFTGETFLPYHQRILKEKKDNGVKVRIIATTKNNMSVLKKLKKLGYNMRYYPVQEIRIFIKDRSVSDIQIVNPSGFYNRTNILIESKELSKALMHYFEYVWKKSEKIK